MRVESQHVRCTDSPASASSYLPEGILLNREEWVTCLNASRQSVRREGTAGLWQRRHPAVHPDRPQGEQLVQERRECHQGRSGRLSHRWYRLTRVDGWLVRKPECETADCRPTIPSSRHPARGRESVRTCFGRRSTPRCSKRRR